MSNENKNKHVSQSESGSSTCSVVPRATGDNKASGWLIDCHFINTVRKSIEDNDYAPSEEDIENVIMSLSGMGVLKLSPLLPNVKFTRPNNTNQNIK